MAPAKEYQDALARRCCCCCCYGGGGGSCYGRCCGYCCGCCGVGCWQRRRQRRPCTALAQRGIAVHARRERTTSARDPRAIRATVRSLAGRTVREEVVARRKELLESCRESRPQHGLLPGKPSTWPPAPCLASIHRRARCGSTRARLITHRAPHRGPTPAPQWRGRPARSPAKASVSRHRGKQSVGDFARLPSLGARPVREGPGTRLGAHPELSSAHHATCATCTALPPLLFSGGISPSGFWLFLRCPLTKTPKPPPRKPPPTFETPFFGLLLPSSDLLRPSSLYQRALRPWPRRRRC